MRGGESVQAATGILGVAGEATGAGVQMHIREYVAA
jgi:hypothetical protein